MVNLPKSWRLYEAGEAVIRPRRRNVFFKGRRRSDRVMAWSVTVLALVVIGIALGRYFPATQSHDGMAFAAAAPAYYRRCADAHAAGVAPLLRGRPGYRSELDADNDGIACEPFLPGR